MTTVQPPSAPPPVYPPPPRSAGSGSAAAVTGLCVGILALVTAVDGRSGALAGLLTAAGLALSIAGVAVAAGRGGSVAAGVVGIVSSSLALVVCLVTLVSVATPMATGAALPVAAARPPAAVLPLAPATTPAVPLAAPRTVEVAPAAPSTIAVTPSTVFRATGSGDDVLRIRKSPGPAVVTFSCPKCTSNTVVRSDGSESLLVNTIGAYGGKRWIDTEDTSTTTQLAITAKGAWTLTVGGLDQATPVAGAVQGRGDDVLLMNTDASSAAITNRGASNFVVQTVSAQGDADLVVNEIGSYTGTVPFSAPAIVQVTSSGSWAITPR